MLSADERDAIEEIERIEPGAPLLTAMRNAQRALTEAGETWAERHGVKNIAEHLPLKFHQRRWFFGEPNIRRFWAAIGCAVAGMSIAGIGNLADLPNVAAPAYTLAMLMPIAVVLFPGKREVLVTPSALIIDRVAIPFSEIQDFTDTTPRFWVFVELKHRNRTSRFTMSGDLYTELRDAIEAWRSAQHTHDAARDATPPAR